MYRTGIDSIGFTSGGTNKMTIGSSGVNVSALTSTGNISTTGTVLGSYVNAGFGGITTPSYSFSGDPNTGMYRPNIDTLGFISGGSSKMTIGSSGITLNGNLVLGANTLTTTNTTVVSNLNADLLDGQHASYYMSAATDNWVNTTGDTMTGRLDLTNNTDATGATNTGSLEIANTLRLDGNEIITNTGTTLALQNDNNGDLDVDASTLFVDASLNRIGMGTTTPETRLHVPNGAIRLGINSSSHLDLTANDIQFDRPDNSYLSQMGSGNLVFTTNGGSANPRLVIDSAGQVGIGVAAAPSYDFHVSMSDSAYPVFLNNTSTAAGSDGVRIRAGVFNDTGSIPLYVESNSSVQGLFYVRGNGTAWLRSTLTAAGVNMPSDRRLKENIEPISYGLEDVLQLNPIKFDYIDGLKEKLGFIAQDIQLIIPEAVHEGEDTMLSLEMDHFIPVAINAIQEQNQLITTNTNNISLNATATSVSELQTLTEQEFTDTNEILNQVQDDMVQAQSNILTIQENANILATQTIAEIEKDILDLQNSLSILTNIDTRVLSLNVDKLMFVNNGILTQSTVDENGIETIAEMTELTLEGLLNVKKIIADEVETGKLSADDVAVVVDGEAPIAGRGMFVADEDIVSIATTAVQSDSLVFVTPHNSVAQSLSVLEIDCDVDTNECTGFNVSRSENLEEELEFNWFIVNGKENIK